MKKKKKNSIADATREGGPTMYDQMANGRNATHICCAFYYTCALSILRLDLIIIAFFWLAEEERGFYTIG